MELEAIRRGAPPLFVARAPSLGAPAVRAVNPAAVAYLTDNGAQAASLVPPRTFLWLVALQGDAPLPLEAVYPAEAPTLRKMAPSLMAPGARALNPSALAFAMASGLPLQWVYPRPPDKSTPAASEYARRVGRSLEDVYQDDGAQAWRWSQLAATVAGLLGGALVAGPVGALAGATCGGAVDLVEWRRKRTAVR